MKVAFDFETEAIEDFPQYPPKPVGLALTLENGERCYYAWGHPTNNNSTEETAKSMLQYYWENPEVELIAHNLSFDMCVAAVHWGLSLTPSATMHDTMVMAFLLDPYAYTYALKPNAEQHLGLPPEERDAIQDWLIQQGIVAPRTKDWGAHICKAPGDLVGAYAIGDTDRTLRLFNEVYWPRLVENGMQDAYRRELDLIPIMLENTIDGIAVDIEKLRQDVQLYENALARIEAFLFEQLGCEPFNVDSDAQLADAIDKVYSGLNWILTKTGKRSTSKANLEITLSSVGGLLGATLQYRASISTCLNTFMKVWLRQAELGDGRIRCQWNTTRSDTAGARTGRLSSKPNFQNIPTLESAKFKQAISAFKEFLEEMGYPPLPNVRSYVVSDDENSVLLDRDFCFTPDTEFLTDTGFKLFDEIGTDDKLAYWSEGLIDYEHPMRRIDKTHKGELVHVQGAKSLDLLATPDHDMVVLDRNKNPTTAYKVKLAKAPFSRTAYGFLPQAGVGPEALPISEAAQILIAAYQADGKLATESTRRVVFKFSKQRKIDRLTQALQALNIEYKVKFWRYKYDSSEFTWVIFYAPVWLFDYVDLQTKLFTRDVLRLPGAFLNELLFWDGSIKSSSYFSRHKANVDIVQELAVLRNRHSTLQWAASPASFNKLGCWLVCIHKLHGSFMKTQSVSRVDYNGRVVCFQMPHGTLIVRRNGRPVVTGNCGQELRVMAHFEDGQALLAYKENPSLDLHQWAADYIGDNLGLSISRKQTKTCSFAILYGSGLATLAAQMGGTTDEAARVKAAYLNALPGLQGLIDGLKSRARQNLPFRTWGGRLYHCEPSKFVDGRWRSYDYKMVNYLIQGSSADVTKQALIRYHRNKKHGRILLCVHDEICISCPIEHWKTEMAILKECMEGIELDAKLISDGEAGRNWHELVSEDTYGVVQASS